ncbi:unnamed protein product [Phytophthora fragariaefolia]|uniref:Unnamed protein product n=1 Tax=Phytophthora fragariaefolia TaxID=1490495 RepID=A0A9W6Y574_9STRA|nr:unnamed protein product [Phytophthora fragariaefolia]
MQLLASCFAKLWDLENSSSAKEGSDQLSTGHGKCEFDSWLLLLSALANSIEVSDDNRDALAEASLCLQGQPDENGAKPVETSVSACALFTHFFQSKVQSYAHLFDLADNQEQGIRGTISFEERNDDWSPEDVILGGCTSLLLGYLMAGSPTNSDIILTALPDKSPRLLLRALSVFAALYSQIGALTSELANSVLHVEEVLKSFLTSGTDASLCAVVMEGDDTSIQQQKIVGKSVSEVEEVEGIGQTCTMSFKDGVKTKRASAKKPPSTLGSRPFKNLCSNIDDSDSELHTDATSVQKNRIISQGCENRTLPQSPGRKQMREKSPNTTPVVQLTPQKSQIDERSPLTALRPDGTLSSPVVARLLKRTRQLVDEFDAAFSKPNRSRRSKRYSLEEGSMPEGDTSPFMVLTMNVTCHDNDNGGVDLLQGNQTLGNAEANTATLKFDGYSRLQSKRRKKETHDQDTKTKKDENYTRGRRGVLDFTPSSVPPSTPLRAKNNSVFLRTPTRNGRSPGLSQESPSCYLTPTKVPSLAPLRVKKSVEMLLTPTRSPSMFEAPVSSSPHRRKAKSSRAPPPSCASAVFDFTD